MNRLNLILFPCLIFIMTMFIANVVYLDRLTKDMDHYIAGTSRAQGDQEAAKIRSCIREKAKISNVVRLEECLPR